MLFHFLFCFITIAQIGIGTSSPNVSSVLDLSSTDKAFLPPRMTTVQRNSISNPSAGMVIYNSDSECIEVYRGLNWFNICSVQSKIKPLIKGLVIMQETGFHNTDTGSATFSLDDIVARPGIFSGVIINAQWKQLEPIQGNLHTNFLDSCLNLIRVYNINNPNTPITARLRLWHGSSAPEWAKSLGGSPINIITKFGVNNNIRNITIGHYWTNAYRTAWKSFLDRLGSIYDSVSIIREICNVDGATQTDEPFIIPLDSSNIQKMLAAGYTDSLELNILNNADSDYNNWPSTRVDYPFNPFHKINSGKSVLDSSVAPNIILQWRQSLGMRGIVSNHDLDTTIGNGLIPIYNQMQNIGAPITLQAYAPTNINWNLAIPAGISYGATSIELWASTIAGGFASYPESNLPIWKDEILSNALKSGF